MLSAVKQNNLILENLCFLMNVNRKRSPFGCNHSSCRYKMSFLQPFFNTFKSIDAQKQGRTRSDCAFAQSDLVHPFLWIRCQSPAPFLNDGNFSIDFIKTRSECLMPSSWKLEIYYCRLLKPLTTANVIKFCNC